MIEAQENPVGESDYDLVTVNALKLRYEYVEQLEIENYLLKEKLRKMKVKEIIEKRKGVKKP